MTEICVVRGQLPGRQGRMYFLTIIVFITTLATTLSVSLSVKAQNSIVNYTCSNGFFRFAMATPTFCEDPLDTGRRALVNCMEGGNVQMSSDPTFIYLDRPVATGDKLIIVGTPPADTVMEVSLFSGEDIVLYLTARLNHLGTTNGVVINSYLGGSWGAEETYLSNFPYTLNTEFKTTISVKATEYEIFVDDVLAYTFAFRDLSPSVTKIRFWGDVWLKSFIMA